MRINHLTIYNFKNLHNFTIDFDQNFFNTVILGRNGIGKSNLLEALIIIFRDLDLGLPPRFPYQITYTCRERTIMVDADPTRQAESIRISVNGTCISYAQFQAQPGQSYLPSHLFGYYSGPGDRMEQYFVEHQKKLYIDLIKGIDTKKRQQPLLYARLIHSQFALLILLSQEDPVFLSILREHLGIEKLHSVLFVLQKPSWMRDSPDLRSVGGDMSHFLERLSALAPPSISAPQHRETALNQSTTIEHLYFYLPNKAAIGEFAKLYGDDPQKLFQALESASISGILSDLKIQVQSRGGHSFTLHLSEGEQQLLMILGLLRITRNDEALFLLDEPDSHLNPALSIQYTDLIRKAVSPQETSQIIMTTHNPIVVSNLDRPQIRILQCNAETKKVRAVQPYESPIGLGFNTVLTSDFFNLNSTLDLSTQKLVNQRRELAAQDVLTEQERQKLSDLNEKLRTSDLSISTDQVTLYHDFVMEYTRRAEAAMRQRAVLTPEQHKQKRELIRTIIKELKEKGDL